MFVNNNDYYYKNGVTAVFKRNLNDKSITFDDVLSVLKLYNFKIDGIFYTNKDGIKKYKGLYNKRRINALFDTTEKTEKIREVINDVRNKDISNVLDYINAINGNGEYYPHDKSTIIKTKEQNKEDIIKYLSRIEDEGEVDMEKVSRQLLIDDDVMYESERNKKYFYLLNESQESKSIDQAKKLLMDKLHYNNEEADEFVRIKLRNDFPILRTRNGGKFILGVTRMFIDGELQTANIITNLNNTIKLISSDAHINEYDRNLNSLSANDLIDRFSKAMSDNLEKEKEEINAMSFSNESDYKIIKIDSFEQSEKYGEYTSWCVTHDKNMFDSYTSDGINQFYFCLKNGFENEIKAEGNGCPLDDYGVSMIAVSVNENGMLSTCTCRWNHDNGGNDNIMNTKQLSELLNVNFFNTFKPNNKWKTLLDDAIKRLKNGEKPEEIFDTYNSFNDCALVELNKKWNLIDAKGNFLSKQWFDEAWDASWDVYEGLIAVVVNDKRNFIDTKGNIISKQWFNEVGYFCGGFAQVKLNGKWNFIDTKGNIISKQWFDNTGNFHNGFAIVVINKKNNFIDTKGNIISKQWFDEAGCFHDEFAKVELNGKYNFIDTKGNIISKQWFDHASGFDDGFAQIELNNKWYLIDKNGNIKINESDDLSDIETKWEPKEGIFLSKSPKRIANYLINNSKDKAQAMKRLVFYMNRAGENLKNKTVLNKVKDLLKTNESFYGNDDIYYFTFKCTDCEDADELQEITHWDEYSNNDYCIDDEYLDNGTIEIIPTEDFLDRISGPTPKEIEYCAINNDLDILWAYDSRDVHWFYEK